MSTNLVDMTINIAKGRLPTSILFSDSLTKEIRQQRPESTPRTSSSAEHRRPGGTIWARETSQGHMNPGRAVREKEGGDYNDALA